MTLPRAQNETRDMASSPTARAQLTRRTVVGAGGAAALTTLGLAKPGFASARIKTAGSLPETMVQAGSVGGPQTPGFPIHHVGVTWNAADTAGRVRVREAGIWTPWSPIRATEAADAHTHRSLRYVGLGDTYEIEPHPEAENVVVHAINTVSGPKKLHPAPSARWTGLTYLSRACWGADESLRFDDDGDEVFPTEYFPVQTLTVHHTVTDNSDPDPAATVRAIYAFQALPPQNFGDIGYHLLIDERGCVYEGRYSGTDPLPVYGLKGRRLLMSNGAHVGDYNAGNVGVALLGTLTSKGPTAAAHRSLVRVLAVLSEASDLNLRGTTHYVNPISGDTATVPTIAGHRDWAATDCPGDRFYPTLPGVRREVAHLLARGEARLAPPS